MTRLGITNYALGALGHRRISDINEVSDVGERTRNFYAQCIGEVIEMYEWPHLITRVALAQITVPSTAPYKYAYASPNDMIKPFKFSTDDLYLIEGGIIYTDNTAPVLIYIRMPSDTEDMVHPLFCRACAFNLATLLAGDLLQDFTKEQQMMQMFSQAIVLARNEAGKQSKQPDVGVEWMYPDTGTRNL